MYNEDTDVLFPPRVIPHLLDLRGDEWRNLVNQIKALKTLDTDRLAFVLMMIRLGGCSSCHADSYRAMRGCTQCAVQTIKRHRGSDPELIKLFEEARIDVARYLDDNKRIER